jgi:hypothetical protein
MSVTIEIHNTGKLPDERAEIAAIVEHALSDKAGDWNVSIIGSQSSDQWQMRIAGPNEFERSYTLEGSAGEHQAITIGRIVSRMVATM